MAEKSIRGVQCLDRAMDILEAVGAAGELGVTELAERVGLHVATVHNILRTLAGRHYLVNSGGRYRLGPAMTALTSRWDPLQTLPAEIQPFLDRLSERTGEAASATILIGYGARLIGFTPGTQAVTIQYPQWEWPNAMSLATGRLLVAFQPEAQWPEFIKRNAGAEPYWSPDHWSKALRSYREADCCLLQNHGGGQTALAFPIRSTGAVIAAIGASAPTFRSDTEHCAMMIREVHAAANELSTQLGWRGAATKLPTLVVNQQKELPS